ncbi:hypothetical protein N183_32820 [Sinorhizobium sp. Sb3]|nr:hypothetical protein N183_32820 [Sinorhizobium sp. Sb3]
MPIDEGSFEAPPLDGEGPLFKQIERAIRNEIVSGRWPCGHRIPPELQMANAYNAARSTVSKAMARLSEAGLVDRKRRQGTTVASPTEAHEVIGYLDVRQEIERKGRRYNYRVLRSRTIKGRSISESWSSIPSETPVLRLDAVHCGFDNPEVLEERYINLDAAPDALGVNFELETPTTWLLMRLPCTRLRHTIRAAVASVEQAKMLGVPEKSIVLISLRQSWAADVPVTFVKLTFPADQNQFVGEFNPPQA